MCQFHKAGDENRAPGIISPELHHAGQLRVKPRRRPDVLGTHSLTDSCVSTPKLKFLSDNYFAAGGVSGHRKLNRSSWPLPAAHRNYIIADYAHLNPAFLS